MSWSMLGHVLSKEQSKDGSDGVSDDGCLTIVQWRSLHSPTYSVRTPHGLLGLRTDSAWTPSRPNRFFHLILLV